MGAELAFVWGWMERMLAHFDQHLRDYSLHQAVYASLYSYESWHSTTNTLSGELSLSLWDVHRLGGLSIYG